MNPTPETDTLDDELTGEWDRCYAQMHSHAMRLEVRLRDITREVAALERLLADATSTETITMARLRQMTVDQIVAWLGGPTAESDLRKITIPET